MRPPQVGATAGEGEEGAIVKGGGGMMTGGVRGEATGIRAKEARGGGGAAEGASQESPQGRGVGAEKEEEHRYQTGGRMSQGTRRMQECFLEGCRTKFMKI